MSKIWKKPINIPSWVEVNIQWQIVNIKWPKGNLSQKVIEWVKAEIKDGNIIVSTDNDENKNLRWLTRTLLSNMVWGVTHWYEKKLLVMWVWYWAKLEWTNLILSIGLSHKVKFAIPQWIQAKVEQDAKWNTIITLNGIDKQYLGEIASNLKALKKPEPYKWKWIRYFDQFIKLKPGKAAKK